MTAESGTTGGVFGPFDDGVMKPITFKIGHSERGQLAYLAQKFVEANPGRADISASEVIRRAIRLAVIRELIVELSADLTKASREAWFRKCGRPAVMRELMYYGGHAVETLRRSLLKLQGADQKEVQS